MYRVNNVIGPSSRYVIGWEDSNRNWFAVVNFDPSVCRACFLCCYVCMVQVKSCVGSVAFVLI